MRSKTASGFTAMSFEIINWPDFIAGSIGSPSAMTIGVFDGLHLGHKELIDRMVKRGPDPTVISFKENPKKLISPDLYDGDLFSLRQKLDAFKKLKVQRAVLIDFSLEFSKLKAVDFLHLLKISCGMEFLVVGSNFRCGYRQQADAAGIKRMNEQDGVPTEIIEQISLPRELGGGPVSSSRLRSAVIQGDLPLAAALTGRNFELDLEGVRPLKMQSTCMVYNLNAIHRIAPIKGRYKVVIHPGAFPGEVKAGDGNIYLYPETELKDCKPDRLEFFA